MRRRDLLAWIEEPGAALLDGWSDEGRWTIALPRPVEELRVGWGEEAKLDDFLDRQAAARGKAGPAAPRQPANPPEPAALFYRHESGIAVSPGGEKIPFGAARWRGAGGRGFADRAWAAGRMEDSLEAPAYRRAHDQIREGIARGDFYQVNLTRRFRARLDSSPDSAPDSRDLFLRLAGDPPPPYSLLLRGGSVDILSASPELFLRADFSSGRVEMRPIKGTAPRFPDPARDRESARRLAESAKDRSENVMIVDLCRNDLGKVCETGSVLVPDLCRVRSHRVHHLESVVAGTLRPEVSPWELLRATFPPGSVTGAPKRAAVSAIRRLEPVPRGVYTGAAGFFDDRGRLAFNVAIRTAVASGAEIRYHAGGGIVWDSVVEAERAEGDLKAAEFFSLFEPEKRQ